MRATTALAFAITGHVPIPQGSLKYIGHRTKGRKRVPQLVSDNDRLAAWRGKIATETKRAMARQGLTKPLDGPLAIEIIFTMQPAAKIPAEQWASTFPDTQHYGDIDKLTRALFDGLAEGGAVINDARFVNLDVTKLFPGHPGALPAPGAAVRLGHVHLADQRPTHSLKKIIRVLEKALRHLDPRREHQALQDEEYADLEEEFAARHQAWRDLDQLRQDLAATATPAGQHSTPSGKSQGTTTRSPEENAR